MLFVVCYYCGGPDFWMNHLYTFSTCVINCVYRLFLHKHSPQSDEQMTLFVDNLNKISTLKWMVGWFGGMKSVLISLWWLYAAAVTVQKHCFEFLYEGWMVGLCGTCVLDGRILGIVIWNNTWLNKCRGFQNNVQELALILWFIRVIFSGYTWNQYRILCGIFTMYLKFYIN